MTTKTLEYKDVTDENRGKETVLETKKGGFDAEYELVHRTAGYYCAGSMAVYQPEHYAVLRKHNSHRSGPAFGKKEQAQNYLKLRTEAVVEVPAK